MRIKGAEAEPSTLPSPVGARHPEGDTRSRAHESEQAGLALPLSRNNAESHYASFVPCSTELTNIFKLSWVFLAVCSFLRGPQSTGKLPRTTAGSPLCRWNNKARPQRGREDWRGPRLASGPLRDNCGSRRCPWLSDPGVGSSCCGRPQGPCWMTGAWQLL